MFHIIYQIINILYNMFILFPHCHNALTLTKKGSPRGNKGWRSDGSWQWKFHCNGNWGSFLRSPGTASNGRNNCFCVSSSALRTSVKIAACYLSRFHATATGPHATAQTLRMWKRPLIARGDHSWSPSSSETLSAKQVPKMLPNATRLPGFWGTHGIQGSLTNIEFSIYSAVTVYLCSLAYSQKSLWLTEHTNSTSHTQIIYFDHDRVLFLCLNNHKTFWVPITNPDMAAIHK